MTLIHLTALEILLEENGPIARGEILIEYRVGSRGFIDVDGDTVTFPKPIHVAIVDGAPVVPVDAPPTLGRCYADIRVTADGVSRVWTANVAIPDVAEVDFGDLVQVNPDTYVPASDPTVLDTVQAELLDGLILQRVTQAEYDLIPIPRPGDVLYVITP